MVTKITVDTVVVLLLLATSSLAAVRQRRSFSWPTFLGGGANTAAASIALNTVAEQPTIGPLPPAILSGQEHRPQTGADHQRVHYPIWRIHKYHGIDLKPVPVSLMRHPTTTTTHHTDNAGGQPIWPQTVDNQPLPSGGIPNELLDLARAFGIRDISQLPSLDEAQNLLGASSRQETITIIKELAETADGRELIRNFLKQQTSDGNDVTTEPITLPDPYVQRQQQQQLPIVGEWPQSYRPIPPVQRQFIEPRQPQRPHGLPTNLLPPPLQLPVPDDAPPSTDNTSTFLGTLGTWTRYFTPSASSTADAHHVSAIVRPSALPVYPPASRPPLWYSAPYHQRPQQLPPPSYPAAIETSQASANTELRPPIAEHSDANQSLAYPEYATGDATHRQQQNVTYNTHYGTVPGDIETIPIPATPEFETATDDNEDGSGTAQVGFQLPALPELPTIHIPRQFVLAQMGAGNDDGTGIVDDKRAGTYVRVRYPTNGGAFNPVPEMPMAYDEFRSGGGGAGVNGDEVSGQYVYNERAPVERVPSIGDFPLARFERVRATDIGDETSLKNSYGLAALPYLFPDDQALELVADDNAAEIGAPSEYQEERVLATATASNGHAYRPAHERRRNGYSDDGERTAVVDSDEIRRRADDAGPQRVSAYDTYATGRISRANSEAIRQLIPTRQPFDQQEDDDRNIIDAIAAKTSHGLSEMVQ